MIKNFIFDWSGTLLDNFQEFSQIYECIRKELNGPKITDEEIRKNFTIPYMKFWNKYYPEMTLEEHHTLFTKYTHQVDEADIYPRVFKTLQNLKQQGHTLFVLSGDPSSKILKQIKKAMLSGLFTKIITDIHEKDIALKEVIEEFNLDPQNTFYIGDTAGDIKSGKSAGIRTVGVTRGFNSKSAIQKANPNYLIYDIIELILISKSKNDTRRAR